MSEDRLHVVADAEEAGKSALESTALAELDDSNPSNTLATVGPMVSALVEALGQIGASGSREVALEARSRAIRAEAREEAHYRFRLSRIGSGCAAGALSGLWLLPQVVAAWGAGGLATALESSLLAPMFAYSLFDPIAFGLALYAWLFFALTWFMEQNDVRRIDWVTTDSARAVLVRRAVLTARQRGDQDSIRKSDLRDALGRGLRPSFALRLLGARDVSASFLDRVTGQHIAELIAQGVLAPSTEASLSPRYLVAEDVSSELQP